MISTELITHDVTFSGSNVKVQVGEDTDVKEYTVNDNGSVSFKVTPDAGYRVTAVKVGEDTLTADADGNYAISDITSDKTVVISAELNTYTINYDATSGTGAPDAQIKTHGVDLTLSTIVPTREGYEFVCWNTMADLTGTDFEPGAVYTANGPATLRAKWTKVYTITYKLDGGAATNPTTYTVESDAITLTNPEKAGYTFAGWTGTDLDKATMEVTIAKGSTGDKEYTATWTQNVAPVTYFKVTYDANKGTGEMPEVSVEAGKDHTLLANEFKAPAGKTFKCWKIGTKEYKAGEKIEVTENVTVKAVWKNKTASSDLDYVPAAGDNFPTFLWAGLLLFSVVALVEVVVLRRKRS